MFTTTQKRNHSARNSKKNSLSDLKNVIRQYEDKVKELECTRASKSPIPSKKKINIRSNSSIVNDTQNFIKYTQNSDFSNPIQGKKTPEYYYLDNFENYENFCDKSQERQEKEIHKTEENMKILKNQLDIEKNNEIECVTKYYLEKIHENEANFERELKKRLEIEIEKLKKKCEENAYEKVKKEFFANRIDFSVVNPKNVNKMKENIENLDFQEKTGKSVSEYALDLEKRFKNVMEQKKSEYERKIQSLSQENQVLRKENHALGQKILEFQSKIEVNTLTAKEQNSENSCIITLNQKYNELLQAYNFLHQKQEVVKNPEKHYCGKCKAFIHTDIEISKKIMRIKEFLTE